MINLDDNQDVPQISLDTAKPSTLQNLDSDLVEDRSSVAALGLSGITGISKTAFKDGISNGREGDLRQEASASVNQSRIGWAKQMIDQYGSSLPDDTLKTMLKAQDPSSVFEDHYAKAFMNYLNWPKDDEVRDNWAWTTAGAYPEEWDRLKSAGEQLMSRYAYLNTKFQDAYGHSTWWDTVKTTTKDLATLGIYGELKMRTGVAGTGTTEGLGLGSNLAAQKSNLFGLPDDQFKNAVDSAVSNMPPDMASRWLTAMVGQSHYEASMDNAATLLNAAGIAQIGAPLAKTAVNRLFTEAVARSAYRRMTTAVTDMISTRPTSVPPAVAGPALAGNTAESGVRKVVIDNINEIYQTNNPVQTLIDRMTGNYDTLNRQASGNVGSFGREVANRVSDMIDSNKDRFVSTVMSQMLVRGDRTPAIELENQVRAVHRGIADMFKGVDNTVLDISNGIYIPGLNVRMYNTAIGTHDAQFFGSLEEAKSFARTKGWIIKGDYDVPPDDMASVTLKEARIRAFRARAETPPSGVSLEQWENEGGAIGLREQADKLQQELDALPRHETGVTIESQPTNVRAQVKPPKIPTESPAEGGPTAQGLGGDIRSSVLEEMRANRIPEPVTEDTGLAKLKDAIKAGKEAEEAPKPATAQASNIIADLDKQLGREATFEEIVAALEKTEDLKSREGFVPKGERRKPLKIIKEPLDLRDLPDEMVMRAPPLERSMIERAKATPEGVTPSESTIVQQGNGYYILHTVFLPEEKDFVRDGLLTSKVGGLSLKELRSKLNLGEVSTGIPNAGTWAGGWMNTVLGRIRSPAERLSTAENLNRIIATHGPSVLLGMLDDGSKPLAQMPKRYWGDFNRLVKYLQQAKNDDTGVPGMWFNTSFDVQDWYLRNIKRMPDPTELQAYFAYRSLMVDDLNMRNLQVMQRKLVMGAKQYSVTYMDNDAARQTTSFFEGVSEDRFPSRGRVLVVNSSQPRGSRWNIAQRFDKQTVQDIEDDVAMGRAKIIHVFDPTSKPMSELEQRTADYVVTYSNQEKPIGFHHVNEQGGGHMVPKWGWFLKQANIESHYSGDTAHHVYNGDNTLFSFRTRGQAEAAIPALERVRGLLQKHVQSMSPGSEAIQRWETEGGATGPNWMQQAADEAQHTGIPFQKLVDWWVGPQAPYNVSEPIRAVSMGNKIIDMDNQLVDRFTSRVGGKTDMNLIDATKDGSLLGKAMVGFTQERDMQGLYTLTRTGTEANPAYAHEPAPLIDPITSMERGYNGVVKSMFIYDMKKYSIEHWLEQAKAYLVDAASIRDNPLSHFYNPQYLDGIPYQIKADLETNRRMAADFVGIGDRTSNSLQKMGQDLSDYLFGRNPKRQIEALYNLPKETDYTRWIRNIAFYGSQISLKTYFTQASTLSNIYFIAGPQQASKATAAMMMYGWWKMASRQPEVLEGLDRSLARYFGWQPGRFTEAIQMMEGAGFHHINETTVARQGMSSAGLQWAENATPITIGWRTASQFGRNVLDYGSLPFNLGTATTRTSAFFTAYLETLEKAPGGVLDRTLRDSMLGRASLLDANMSTAFNTRLNKGLFSVPFQFGTYDKNMTELMWGKQLTPREKTALFTSSSVMFGLRGGFYAALGFPAANYVLGKTETALGYVPGENPLYDSVVNGFPSWMFHFLSGGPFIDFSKWGNKGIQSLEDFVSSDKSMAELATGAAGGVFEQAWQNTYGLRKAFVDMFDKDGYRVTSDDVLQAAKTLAAVSDINKGWLAFQTGKLFTRNDTYVTDISKTMAAIQAITGLGPVAASDVYIKQKQISANDESVKTTQRIIDREILLAYRYHDQGDPNTADIHFRNAGVLMRGYIPVEKQNQTMQEAFRNVETSLRDRVDQKLFRDNPDMLTRIRSTQ